MSWPSLRLAWAMLAAGAAIATAASLLSTLWLGLDPCHLCIFQRLLFMILTLLAILAALGSGVGGRRLPGRLLGALTLPISATGAGVAAYQSWLQSQPPDQVSCTAGPPGLIERLVEWLGQHSPDLFMATGFCEDRALVVLGLSLANWAVIAFALILGAGIWILSRQWASLPGQRKG